MFCHRFVRSEKEKKNLLNTQNRRLTLAYDHTLSGHSLSRALRCTTTNEHKKK
jgi:hypothetical protein